MYNIIRNDFLIMYNIVRNHIVMAVIIWTRCNVSIVMIGKN
ncbi:unnamed protein product [Arabidopsis halleri]